MENADKLKMYIAVLDEVPDHMVPVLVAHAVLNAHIEFDIDSARAEYGRNTFPIYKDWLYNSFKKVVLRVNRKEFEKIYALDDVLSGHENTVLNGERSCIVACPRYEIPNVLKYAKMWKPKQPVYETWQTTDGSLDSAYYRS